MNSYQIHRHFQPNAHPLVTCKQASFSETIIFPSNGLCSEWLALGLYKLTVTFVSRFQLRALILMLEWDWKTNDTRDWLLCLLPVPHCTKQLIHCKLQVCFSPVVGEQIFHCPQEFWTAFLVTSSPKLLLWPAPRLPIFFSSVLQPSKAY